MKFKFPRLKNISRENLQHKFKPELESRPITTILPHTHRLQRSVSGISSQIHHFRSQEDQNSEHCSRSHGVYHPELEKRTRVFSSDEAINSHPASGDQSAIYVQNVLKFRRHKSAEEIESALNRCGLVLTEDFILNVLRRHRSDWKPAFIFFNWISKGGGKNRYLPGSVIHNEILDILGKCRRFEEVTQVLDEMSKRKEFINEETYSVLLNRYAAAHKVEEAIGIFYKRQEFGMQIDLAAFQSLLKWLCRYKHVEAAETLFHSKGQEFHPDIKTRNIILNGWCVLGNVHEAKRFWRDTIQSRCQPDIFTYGTLINALTKKGKLGTALKLYRAMWDKGLNPDVVICNCIIDALCFKKRIPKALEIFKEMGDRGCASNVATYNTLIKHLSKIRRMEKVDELLDEMEERKGECWPNSVTFSYLLKSLREPEEVPVVLQRMERSRCKITSDMYNLILRLYMGWDLQERVKSTWNEMEERGFGPDRRSYTVMIHGLYDKGRIDEAVRYFREMTLKGMVPEPRTEKLLNGMNISVQERRGKRK